ncbi:MAG: hypothetical protein ACOCZK_01615 [Planctomycetota bacterium]
MAHAAIVHGNRARCGAAYHVALMTLIVLVLVSMIFGYLAWDRYKLTEGVSVGDPEAEEADLLPDNSLQATYDELIGLKADIEELQEQIALREKQLARYDLHLSSRGVYFDAQGNKIRGGQDDPTPWESSRSYIEELVKRSNTVVESYNARVSRGYPDMRQVINDLRNEINQTMQQSTRQDDDFERAKNRLLEELDALEREKEQNEEQYHRDYSELATRRTQLDQRIRELLELRLRELEELQPDGRVVKAMSTSNYVIIDIGSRDRVRLGLKFEVFRYIRGRYTEKGMVEVIDVEPTQATCRVLDVVDPRRLPLANGDMIGNPVFSTRRSMHFVLAGEFELYNKSDLKEFIEEAGSTAEVLNDPQEMQPGVDFLVAGSRSDLFKNKAREFHVIAMTEAQLVKYLQTTFDRDEAREEASAAR